MIVTAILKAFFAILRFLMSPIHLPSLSDTVLGDVFSLMSYITGNAYNLAYFILPRGTVQTLLVILLAVIAAKHIYHFVMWILRKIPALGVS